MLLKNKKIAHIIHYFFINYAKIRIYTDGHFYGNTSIIMILVLYLNLLLLMKVYMVFNSTSHSSKKIATYIKYICI